MCVVGSRMGNGMATKFDLLASSESLWSPWVIHARGAQLDTIAVLVGSWKKKLFLDGSKSMVMALPAN